MVALEFKLQPLNLAVKCTISDITPKNPAMIPAMLEKTGINGIDDSTKPEAVLTMGIESRL